MFLCSSWVARVSLRCAPALLVACSSASDPVEVVLPMQPVSEGRLTGVVEVSGAAGAPTLALDTSLTFAIGPEYPSTFTASMPTQLYAPCGMLEGTSTWREISGSSDAIQATLDDTARLQLEVRGPGSADIVLAGELVLQEPTGCDLPIETPLPFELRVASRAVVPSGARVEVPSRCADAIEARVATSVALLGEPFELALVDDAGEPVHVDNAAPGAQMEVRVRGEFAPEVVEDPPATVAELAFPATAGVVEIAPVGGAPLSVEVIDAGRVTDIEVTFQLAGTAAGPVLLESGASYGAEGWNRTANWIAPMVDATRVGADALCSPPTTAWFVLRSLTPAACHTVPVPASHMGGSGGKRHTLIGDGTNTAAQLAIDGTCTLTLEAPGAAGGAGLVRSLSASFANVHMLDDE
jgi:hypothetical protein